MELKDFTIGKFFWMSGKKYKCTDKGTRVVVALLWNPGEEKIVLVSGSKNGKRFARMEKRKVDSSDLSGPPYIGEQVIFEYDFGACARTKQHYPAAVVKQMKLVGQKWKRIEMARTKAVLADMQHEHKKNPKEFHRAGWPIRSPK